MATTKKMTFNEAYHHLKKHELTDEVRLRAELRERRSPGKGFLAILELRYKDLTRTKLEHLSSPAYAVVATFPESCRNEYDRAVNKAIKIKNVKSEKTMAEAELEATLMMLKDPRAQVLFVDPEVMKDPAFLTELVNRNDLDGRDFDVVRNRLAHDGAVPLENIVDADLKVLSETLLERVTGQINVPDHPAMHPSWRNHFNAQARRLRQQATGLDPVF